MKYIDIGSKFERVDSLRKHEVAHVLITDDYGGDCYAVIPLRLINIRNDLLGLLAIHLSEIACFEPDDWDLLKSGEYISNYRIEKDVMEGACNNGEKFMSVDTGGGLSIAGVQYPAFNKDNRFSEKMWVNEIFFPQFLNEIYGMPFEDVVKEVLSGERKSLL